MAEEIKLPQPKQIKAEFAGDAELPTHYVNIVNVRAGVEEFFITLGTGIPPEIADIKDLDNIDTIKAHSLFRFAMSRVTMKQVISLMQNIYDQQTKQIEMMRTLQEKGEEDDRDNNIL